MAANNIRNIEAVDAEANLALQASTNSWLSRNEIVSIYDEHDVHPFPTSVNLLGPGPPFVEGLFFYPNKRRFRDLYDWVDVEEERRRNCRSQRLPGPRVGAQIRYTHANVHLPDGGGTFSRRTHHKNSENLALVHYLLLPAAAEVQEENGENAQEENGENEDVQEENGEGLEEEEETEDESEESLRKDPDYVPRTRVVLNGLRGTPSTELAGKAIPKLDFDIVTEFIKGLVETYPGLQYLDGFPKVKAVLRADVSAAKYDKLAVISGGGSGREPGHAMYVGEGMLTAAICRYVCLASPPVHFILAGIRAVTGSEGCLLIVKNYTGDRLNFGLAAEQAKSEGYKVETVIVGEDCALPPPRGIAGRRGLAGTVLVHKVAGAAAAAGLSLEKVATEAKCASEMVGTMGVALSVCTLPGQATSDRLGAEKMELGLGIHGEPGATVVDVQPVDVVVSHVLLQQILSPETNYVPITRGNRVVLMVNGLGGTPLMELMIAAGKAIPKLQLEFGLAVDRVYTSFFMTSLDMAGFSISIMKADQSTLDRLDAPTKAPNWPVGTDGNRPPAKIPVPVPPSRSIKSSESQSRPLQLSKEGRILEAAIQEAATVFISLKDNLNEWDGKVGDGDCGSTMYRGAIAILEDMKSYYPLNDAAETVNEIGSSIKRAMGGTSGIIYHLLCKAAYAELKAHAQSEVTPKNWSEALKSAIASASKYGGASAGYKTMLDALIPASQVLEEKLSGGEDPISAFILSAEAATAGAESTIQMQAQAGRSSYVSAEILATVPDPGAMAARDGTAPQQEP